MKEKEYEQDLAIDPYCLDEEWLRQPGLYMKYSSMAADAQKRRDQLKERLEVIKAELDKKIRLTPSNYVTAEKVTETSIAFAILLQPEYKEAANDLTESNYELNMLQSAVRALDHKRSALENEVKLWLGSYFSGPKEPRDIPGGKRIVDIARDKVSSRMREEMNKPASQEPGQVDQPRQRRGQK